MCKVGMGNYMNTQVEVAASGRSWQPLTGDAYARAFIHPCWNLHLQPSCRTIWLRQLERACCPLVCFSQRHLYRRFNIFSRHCTLSCAISCTPLSTRCGAGMKVGFKEIGEGRLSTKEIFQVFFG